MRYEILCYSAWALFWLAWRYGVLVTKRIIGRLAILSGLFFFPGFNATAVIDASLQMQLGNPSNATADTNNHSHYLIQRPIEALDYNDLRGQPNWASWDLTSADANN